MNLDLSFDQENKLNQILDKGIDSLRNSSYSQFKAEKDSPRVSTDKLSTIFQDPKNFNSEIEDLQNQISKLESKFTHQSQKSKTSQKPKSKLLRSIQNSEKEIKKLERSISPSFSRKSSYDQPKELKKLQSQLVEERQHVQKIKLENQQLKKKLANKQDLSSKISKLESDYKQLLSSFQRSENLRTKQKEIINQLKQEISGEEPQEHYIRPPSAVIKKKSKKLKTKKLH